MNYVPSKDYLRHKIIGNYTPINVSPNLYSSHTLQESINAKKREPCAVTRNRLDKENQRVVKLDLCLKKIDQYFSKLDPTFQKNANKQSETQEQTDIKIGSVNSERLEKTSPLFKRQHPKQLKSDQNPKLESLKVRLTRHKRYSYSREEDISGQSYLQTQITPYPSENLNLNPNISTPLSELLFISNQSSSTCLDKTQGLDQGGSQQTVSTQWLTSVEFRKRRVQNIETITNLNCQISIRIKNISKLMETSNIRDVNL